MEMSMRPAKVNERMYSYSQSRQIMGQTGSIGHLRGDMDTNGIGFYTTWDTHIESLKTDEFRIELDEVVNKLRFDEKFHDVLRNRNCLASYCHSQPDSEFVGNYTQEYAFRVDTDKRAYILRLNPTRGDYNFYIYAYDKKSFDDHLEHAQKGIRFITPQYKEKFRIDDGDEIKVTMRHDEVYTRTCRYIDDYHFEMSGTHGDNIYHICEFAERMESADFKELVPMRASLPNICYSTLPSSGKAILINKGERGYVPCKFSTEDKEFNKQLVDRNNKQLGITKAQEAAMIAGSMFGFDVPAADPKNYDENGMLLRHKFKERGEER